LLWRHSPPAAAGPWLLKHQFANSPDGASPAAKMLQVTCGGSHYLYGTTETGGISGQGTVFNYLLPSGPQTVITSFTNGGTPLTKLIQVGNYLYGTTALDNGAGTVFRIPIGSCGPEPQTVIWSFGGSGDGAFPAAALLYLKDRLYGTTAYGGSAGLGTVFQCALTGPCSVMYSFQGGPADGATPMGALAFDASPGGALYGTTEYGGTSGLGAVFKVGLWANFGVETIKHNFAGGPADGAYPTARLLMHAGTFFSTTSEGGASTNCTGGCGTLFNITPSGTEALGYSFAGGADGANPLGGLAWVGPPGNKFVGTTYAGGNSSSCAGRCGTVFVASYPAESALSTPRYRFTMNHSGYGPAAEPTVVPPGSGPHTLYGTTSGGVGAYGNGTIFSIW
jgi:uncharacterized repeat protein (TIGR03803 family)